MIKGLEAQGHVEAELNPLYLPRHSIRAMIVVAFLSLAIYLYYENKLFESPALSIFGVVTSYMLGILVRQVISWWYKGSETTAMRGWEDLKAAVVLVAMYYTAGAYLFDRPDLVPHQMRNLTLGLVLFYFGSR